MDDLTAAVIGRVGDTMPLPSANTTQMPAETVCWCWHDSGDRVAVVPRKRASPGWCSGCGQDVNVTLLQSNAVPAKALDVAPWQAVMPCGGLHGRVANFTLQTTAISLQGVVACKLAGKVTAHTCPTHQAQLTASGCAAAAAYGVCGRGRRLRPGGFRLVADNGTVPLDLWATRR